MARYTGPDAYDRGKANGTYFVGKEPKLAELETAWNKNAKHSDPYAQGWADAVREYYDAAIKARLDRVQWLIDNGGE